MAYSTDAPSGNVSGTFNNGRWNKREDSSPLNSKPQAETGGKEKSTKMTHSYRCRSVGQKRDPWRKLHRLLFFNTLRLPACTFCVCVSYDLTVFFHLFSYLYPCNSQSILRFVPDFTTHDLAVKKTHFYHADDLAAERYCTIYTSAPSGIAA